MFESSLIDLDARPHSRRKWTPLPIALALHGLVLASVGVAQVWNVAAVGDPEIVTPLQVTFVPSLPAAVSQAPHSAPVQKPAASSKPVQPDTKQLPDTPVRDPQPETQVGPPVLDGPATPWRGEPVTDFGPSNGPQTGPGVDDPTLVVPVDAPPKDEILFVGGAVSRPVLLSGPPPRFTKIARTARIEGVVVLQAVIDERGRVTDVRILRGLPMGLDQAALETVRDWTFEPAKLQGRPVKVYYTLTVNFRLQG